MRVRIVFLKVFVLTFLSTFSSGAKAIYMPPEVRFDDVYPIAGNVPRNFQLLLTASDEDTARYAAVRKGTERAVLTEPLKGCGRGYQCSEPEFIWTAQFSSDANDAGTGFVDVVISTEFEERTIPLNVSEFDDDTAPDKPEGDLQIGRPQTQMFNGSIFEVRSIDFTFSSLQDDFAVAAVAIWKVEAGERELEYFAPIEEGVTLEAFALVNKGNLVELEVSSIDFAGNWSEVAVFEVEPLPNALTCTHSSTRTAVLGRTVPLLSFFLLGCFGFPFVRRRRHQR